MKRPIILGICVCLALLMAKSAEGQVDDVSFMKSSERQVPLSATVDLMKVPSFFNPVLQSTEINDGIKPDNVPPFVPGSPSPYYREDKQTDKGSYKVSSVEAPVIFRQFSGANDSKYTPPDNCIAISNAGYIISVMNSNYRIFAPNSSTTLKYSSFFDALSGVFPAITGTYYDPKVIYDAENDRFIMCILNGTTSSESHIVLMFSKTGNPSDGWNAFDIKGDVFAKGESADYPNIGISKSDLFLTANLFDDAGNEIEPVILQIAKSGGYSGGTLKYVSFEVIKNPGGVPAIASITPASHGLGKDYGDSMFFVNHNSNAANNVRLLEITGSEASGVSNLSVNTLITYKALTYSNPAPSMQKSASSTLNAGDIRTKQAFYLDSTIHYVFSTRDAATGFTDLVYARLNVRTKTLQHLDLGATGFNFVYPSIASLALNEHGKSVMIGYCKGGSSLYPEIDAVVCDSTFNFSTSLNIVAGAAAVSGIGGPEYRWGDYTGMARQYSTHSCFFSGHYGTGGNYETSIVELGLNSTHEGGINDNGPSVAKAVSIFPNPVSDQFTLEFETPSKDYLTIRLMDMQGKMISCLFEGTTPGGDHSFSFNKAGLPAGIYSLIIESSTAQAVSRKIVVE